MFDYVKSHTFDNESYLINKISNNFVSVFYKFLYNRLKSFPDEIFIVLLLIEIDKHLIAPFSSNEFSERFLNCGPKYLLKMGKKTVHNEFSKYFKLLLNISFIDSSIKSFFNTDISLNEFKECLVNWTFNYLKI
ncbi:MAG: hypothetical protein P8Y97_14910 [Candidatus Lokiarchaeota archaeon]